MAISSRHCVVYLLISLLNGVHCQSLANQEEQQRFNPSVSQFRMGNTQLQVDEQVCNEIATNALEFAHSIALQLTDRDGVYSEVFSPVSIMSALTLLLLGAKGRSYEQLKLLLNVSQEPKTFFEQFGYMLQDMQQSDLSHLLAARERPNWTKTAPKNSIRRPSSQEKLNQYEYVVKLANGIFTQNGFNLNPDYKKIVTSLYKSELRQLDFHNDPRYARSFINDWVERNTFGKIPQIISGEISQSTNVIIGSALYFKGFWENSFFESATDWDNFYVDGVNTTPIKVQMMATGGVFPFYDAKEYNCRIIGLPYKGNLSTMYIIHPYNSSRYQLDMLHRNLNAKSIENMISKMVRSTALVAFPKMKFERTHNMKHILNRFGVHEIFTSGRSDLSLISEAMPAYNLRQPSIDANNVETTKSSQSIRNRSEFKDRFNEAPLFFTRFGMPENEYVEALNSLETKRSTQTYDKPNLYVEDVLHKVVFDVNEYGTEAAAATLAVLFRSGTDVLFRVDSPFILLIRHDLTKLPLFYGVINEPILN